MKNWRIWLFILTLSIGCKKPYNPKVINSPRSYLIVEGTINTNDTTTIKLSRTVNLSSKITSNPVEGVVYVEGDDGSSYPLFEYGTPGTYKLVGVTLDNSHKYRVRITAGDNNEVYVSDFEGAKVTPPIDSVGFVVNSNGIQIYANSHDPANATRYYRFDYVETWRFHAMYNSGYESNGSAVVIRPVEDQIYYCFASDISSSIILGSTAKLTQDALYQLPVTAIASTSEKIETRYSILLREYALTADAYKFWATLKKNTEELGSIFDAEPSTIAGNIHNEQDPTDVVVGYISVGTISQKRIFIDSQQLPSKFLPTYPYECGLDSAFYSEKGSGVNTVASKILSGSEQPVGAFYGPSGPSPIGFTASDISCTDCTLRGVRQQPDFWK